jgi:hypothetical protein
MTQTNNPLNNYKWARNNSQQPGSIINVVQQGLIQVTDSPYIKKASIDHLSSKKIEVNGDVSINNSLLTKSLGVSQNALISENLRVIKDLDIDNNLNVTKRLTVGSGTVSEHLTVGSGTVSGHLTAGYSTVSGHLTAGSGTVSGHLTAGSGTVSGHLTAGSGTVSGHLTVGSGKVYGHLTAGSGTVSGHLTAGSGTVSAHLTVGSGTVSGNLNVYGKLSVNVHQIGDLNVLLSNNTYKTQIQTHNSTTGDNGTTVAFSPDFIESPVVLVTPLSSGIIYVSNVTNSQVTISGDNNIAFNLLAIGKIQN